MEMVLRLGKFKNNLVEEGSPSPLYVQGLILRLSHFFTSSFITNYLSVHVVRIIYYLVC